MYLLTGILMFVILSFVAACNGDYSGLAAIGKVIGVIVLCIGVMWLCTQPILLVIVIAILIIIVVNGSSSKRRKQ